MGKTPEQILSDIRGIKAETDPHDITAPRLGGTLEDMLAFSKDTAEKVDGLPAPSEQNYKGKITITDLLALSVDIGDNDLYLVYSSGSDDEGWSEEGSFTLNGNSYADGTFVQWMGDGWMAVNAEDVNIEKVALFNPLSDKMDIIVKTYPQTSYDHLYGRSRYGMMIADVACYELDDETGAYKPKIESMTGQYAGSTNLKTLIVPYARRYLQGGEYHYEGGVLSAADYQRLMEGQQVDGGVFVATYGETTFDELVDAYEEGKMIVVRNGGNTSVLGYFYVNEFRFYSVDLYSYDSDAVVTCISMSFNDGWSIPYSRTTENRGNRVSSTALTPSQLTDYKYLSALAVKTLIEEYVEALARVAKTGDYNDLINKPTIPPAVTDVVKYTAQSLTDAQKAQARQNIGAGTSNFSGNYNDLANKPAIPDVTGLVTLDTDQRITGSKTFKASLWGQLSLWADGSYKEHPCLNFYSVQGQSVEGVGSIGVERTGYLSGYPAYWQSQQGLPQRLVREDEKGSSVNPIYIDDYGKTKQCNISFPEYSYKIFSYKLDISQGVSDEFTLGTLVTLSGGSLPSGVTLSMGRKSSSRLSMRINSSLIGENSKVQLESVMITAGSFKTGYEVAIVNEDQQGVSSGSLNFEFILRSMTTGEQVSASELATSTTYDLYFHVGMMCKN